MRTLLETSVPSINFIESTWCKFYFWRTSTAPLRLVLIKKPQGN